MNKLLSAVSFAAIKHRDQRRKDALASPYINHPIALANVLANEAGVDDERVLIAAILHDTVEDTETTEQELIREFGQEIAAIVMEVTDDKALAKAERKRLQVEHAATISRRAKLVKLADKICNLRDIASSPPTDWSEVSQEAGLFRLGKVGGRWAAWRQSKSRINFRRGLQGQAVTQATESDSYLTARRTAYGRDAQCSYPVINGHSLHENCSARRRASPTKGIHAVVVAEYCVKARVFAGKVARTLEE
jgi:GTP diphosphokinase / guanosine-3',5'-bis(diphosphate) 3'-diphosphatase